MTEEQKQQGCQHTNVRIYLYESKMIELTMQGDTVVEEEEDFELEPTLEMEIICKDCGAFDAAYPDYTLARSDIRERLEKARDQYYNDDDDEGEQ